MVRVNGWVGVRGVCAWVGGVGGTRGREAKTKLSLHAKSSSSENVHRPSNAERCRVSLGEGCLFFFVVVIDWLLLLIFIFVVA
jgi:hypothetical protein